MHGRRKRSRVTPLQLERYEDRRLLSAISIIEWDVDITSIFQARTSIRGVVAAEVDSTFLASATDRARSAVRDQQVDVVPEEQAESTDDPAEDDVRDEHALAHGEPNESEEVPQAHATARDNAMASKEGPSKSGPRRGNVAIFSATASRDLSGQVTPEVWKAWTSGGDTTGLVSQLFPMVDWGSIDVSSTSFSGTFSIMDVHEIREQSVWSVDADGSGVLAWSTGSIVIPATQSTEVAQPPLQDHGNGLGFVDIEQIAAPNVVSTNDRIIMPRFHPNQSLTVDPLVPVINPPAAHSTRDLLIPDAPGEQPLVDSNETWSPSVTPPSNSSSVPPTTGDRIPLSNWDQATLDVDPIPTWAAPPPALAPANNQPGNTLSSGGTGHDSQPLPVTIAPTLQSPELQTSELQSLDLSSAESLSTPSVGPSTSAAPALLGPRIDLIVSRSFGSLDAPGASESLQGFTTANPSVLPGQTELLIQSPALPGDLPLASHTETHTLDHGPASRAPWSGPIPLGDDLTALGTPASQSPTVVQEETEPLFETRRDGDVASEIMADPAIASISPFVSPLEAIHLEQTVGYFGITSELDQLLFPPTDEVLELAAEDDWSRAEDLEVEDSQVASLEPSVPRLGTPSQEFVDIGAVVAPSGRGEFHDVSNREASESHADAPRSMVSDGGNYETARRLELGIVTPNSGAEPGVTPMLESSEELLEEPHVDPDAPYAVNVSLPLNEHTASRTGTITLATSLTTDALDAPRDEVEKPQRYVAEEEHTESDASGDGSLLTTSQLFVVAIGGLYLGQDLLARRYRRPDEPRDVSMNRPK